MNKAYLNLKYICAGGGGASTYWMKRASSITQIWLYMFLKNNENCEERICMKQYESFYTVTIMCKLIAALTLEGYNLQINKNLNTKSKHIQTVLYQ